MDRYFRRLGALLLLVTVFTQTLSADDVTDSIDEALEAYKDGEYSEAIESLSYASQVISQKKAQQIGQYLPDPLDGWSLKDKQGSGGNAVFGGGSASERTYRKGSSSITVSIAADSPAMQSMMMLFTNPMFASSAGGELTKIKRQKAIVTYDGERQKGDIKIVVKKRFFVSIDGNRVSREELMAYAEAIDYKKLSRLP